MSTSYPYAAPAPEMDGPGGSLTTGSLRIKKVDILAAAKMVGTLYALLGLLFGLFFSMVAILGVAAGGGNGMAGGLATGVGAIVLLPLFYGIAGFLLGVIGAFLYNVVAAIVGGIVLEVEADR